ncbi:putative membrane protein [Mumia flava]|uniref:Putative membrane protein n=1 Tax=Mumia flava TaxID=1348852 RepID=A0A2M9B805_9ACTN|nr:putative membrane protein [Mumia flava]
MPPTSQGLRTHPASALVRVWIWIVAGLVAFGRNVLEEQTAFGQVIVSLLAIVAVAAVVGVAFGYLTWWFTRFTIDGREIRLESGILTRRSRRAPYERIQSVDINEPFVARIFGLCELTLELAGGSDSQLKLQYLKRPEAERLRGVLLERAQEATGEPGAATDPAYGGPAADLGTSAVGTPRDGASELGTSAPADPAAQPGQPSGPYSPDLAPPIVVVKPGRLVLATLLSAEFLIPAVLTLGVLAVGVFAPGIVIGLVPFLFWMGQVVFNRVVAQWEFTLRRHPRGLHVTRGLLTRVSQTIPYDRVQAFVEHQAALWRPWGLVRVEVTVAGRPTDSDGRQSTATLLPVATSAETQMVIAQLSSRVDPPSVPRVAAPRRSAWLAPIGWRFRAAGSDEAAFVADRGWVSHRTDVVPHAKTQSVSVTQGPLQRLLGVADLRVHTPNGPVDAHGRNLAADDAAELARQQVAHARAARTD